MHLSLTSRQTLCLFCAVVFLSSCVLRVFSSGDIKPKTCCPKVTTERFKGHIEKCAYIIPKGKCLEAYVFRTKNGKQHCISVEAKWVNSTLELLKKKNISCEKM